MFGTGVRVYRGPDWVSSYGNADGGVGNLGTILQAPGTIVSNYAQVLWDSGRTGLYRVSSGGKFDICRAKGRNTELHYTCAQYQLIITINHLLMHCS